MDGTESCKRYFRSNSSVYTCKLCNFSSTRVSHIEAHKSSRKHMLYNFNSEPAELEVSGGNGQERNESNKHEETDVNDTKTSCDDEVVSSGFEVEEEDESDQQVPQAGSFSNNRPPCPWYPFASKVEFLLYVLLHSKTHRVSDEVGRFVFFILNQAGVQTPSFNSLKQKQFGDLNIEKLLLKDKDREGVPFWTLKPSELLRLSLANPETSSSVLRYPLKTEQVNEQICGEKWLKELKSPWGRCGNGSFYLGQFVKFTFQDEIYFGKIKLFLDDEEATQNTCLETALQRNVSESRETLEMLNATISKAQKKQMQTASGLKHYENYVWDVINPHSDFPVGTLHWLYLGLVKHLIQICVGELNDHQQELLMAHLVSVDQSSFEVPLKIDMIKNIGSRQGKDFKHFIQIAHFIFGFAGLKTELVEMVCKLSWLCKQINIIPVDMEAVDICLNDYLAQIKEHAPQLTKKVKTHLSTHFVADIKRHGPPAAFAEDVFEKNHGTIRQSLFTQNQLARSRDSARCFAENIVLTHVLDGGFFQVGLEWKQSSQDLRLLGNQVEVRRFLGHQQDVPKAQGVLKAEERTSNCRTVSHKFYSVSLDEQQQILQACLYVGVSPQRLQSSSITWYRAARTKNNRVVNKDCPIVYINHEHQEKCGMFCKSLSVTEKSGEVTSFVIIEEMRESERNDYIFGCKVLSRCQQYTYVPAKNVVHLLCLIHDCIGGGCQMQNSIVNVHVEQEKATLYQNTINHNTSHNFYFVNKYRQI